MSIYSVFIVPLCYMLSMSIYVIYIIYIIKGTIPEHNQNDGDRIPVVEEVFVQRIAYRCV